MKPLTRRSSLSGALAFLVTPFPVAAASEDVTAAMADMFADRSMTEGRIAFELPALAENGNSVPLGIEVESPMTPEDFCSAVHIFAPANPLPLIGSFRFTPVSGRARCSTRIRVNDTQRMTAVAEMNDGRLFTVSRSIVVTLAACIDPG